MASRASRYRAHRRRRHNGNGKGMPPWTQALVGLGALFVVAAAVLAGVGYGIYQSYADDLIPPDEAIAKLPRSGARILDRDGEFLYQFVDDQSGLRQPVPVEDFWPWLVLATVAAEDASFFDNPGVNFRGLAAAAWENFSPFSGGPGYLEGRGGSSITQQLVKNVYFSPEQRAERSVERKLKETVYALELTRKYDKKTILGWYLNLISYGNIYNGAEAAAQGYFGKKAKELTLAEAATLAAIPSCPSCYDPINQPLAALDQRNLVLKRMHEEGYITSEQFWEAAAQPLELAPQQFPVEAPHFVFNVVQPELERLFGEEALRRDDLVVYTTIDLDVQKRAEAILEEWITTFEYSGGHNGAVVAIDPKNAEIVVYVGSRDYFRADIDGQNDMANALNSPGSSFKPFTYLTAFMELGWGPGTMILDTPFPSEYWDGDRPPRNPGTGFQGPISVRNSLGNSLNIPAVKTIMYAGVPTVVQQARTMGITSLDENRLGPSLTIGGVDVKLVDMVYGFTAFPNLGIQRGVPSAETQLGHRPLDPISIIRVENREGEVLYPLVDGQPSPDGPAVQEERVAPAAETYMITDILTDGSAQCLVFGCGGLLVDRPMAVKTGTSEPYADSFNIGDTWAIAYTPQLVVGSWFGNADNSPMTDITSTSVSWRTVRDFMVDYHQDLPVETFTRPDGLTTASVCMPSGLKATDACPRKTPNDLFATGSLPQEEDNWWTTARIDTRTGKLASELTPEEFVEERFFLRIPENVTGFARHQAEEWASELDLSSSEEPPTETTDIEDLPIAITSPAPQSQVNGIVSISGRAASPDFQSYRVDYRFDLGGEDWVTIGSSSRAVPDGTLIIWDTRTLEPGLYSIRLVVNDAERGEIITRVQLIVTATGPPTTPGVLPTPQAFRLDGLLGPGPFLSNAALLARPLFLFRSLLRDA